MRARTLRRVAMRALTAAAPRLLSGLEAAGYVGPAAGVVTVERDRTSCAVVPRAQAVEMMRSAGGFNASELARVGSPSPSSALPVVMVGLVRGTARLLSLSRGGVA